MWLFPEVRRGVHRVLVLVGSDLHELAVLVVHEDVVVREHDEHLRVHDVREHQIGVPGRVGAVQVRAIASDDVALVVDRDVFARDAVGEVARVERRLGNRRALAVEARRRVGVRVAVAVRIGIGVGVGIGVRVGVGVGLAASAAVVAEVALLRVAQSGVGIGTGQSKSEEDHPPPHCCRRYERASAIC
jgi:hypothetical protein